MTSREKQGTGFQDWAELRNHLIDQYGEAPHPATEQDIIDAYQLHPDQIEKAALNVAHDVTAGNARSGWGVLRARANQLRTPIANPTRPASLEREKRIGRAEQELRNAGIYIDRQAELILHLFNERGLLHPYAQADFERGNDTLTITGDQALVDRMTNLWAELRPTGERAEADALERAQTWKQQQATRMKAFAEARAKLEAELAAKQPAPANADNDDLPL